MQPDIARNHDFTTDDGTQVKGEAKPNAKGPGYAKPIKAYPNESYSGADYGREPFSDVSSHRRIGYSGNRLPTPGSLNPGDSVELKISGKAILFIFGVDGGAAASVFWISFNDSSQEIPWDCSGVTSQAMLFLNGFPFYKIRVRSTKGAVGQASFIGVAAFEEPLGYAGNRLGDMGGPMAGGLGAGGPGPGFGPGGPAGTLSGGMFDRPPDSGAGGGDV